VWIFLLRQTKKGPRYADFLSLHRPSFDLCCSHHFSRPQLVRQPQRPTTTNMSECNDDRVDAARRSAKVKDARKTNANHCLACGFPVDGERSLLGVVNRFQEMLAYAGYAVGELVMRNEPGGRTTLRLDLTRDSHRVEEMNEHPELSAAPPDCAVAAAAGRRSSCRMCASACSISNCDADCDHDAAETSPAHMEHQSAHPSESKRLGSLPAATRQASPAPAHRPTVAPQLIISEPPAHHVSPYALPSGPQVRQNFDPPMKEHQVHSHSNVQAAGHHHHHHHHHHHRQRGNRASNLLAISHDDNDISARDELLRGDQFCVGSQAEARALHLAADNDVSVEKAILQNTPTKTDRPRPEGSSHTARKRIKVRGNTTKDALTGGGTSLPARPLGGPTNQALDERHAIGAHPRVDTVTSPAAPASSASAAPAFLQVHETSLGEDAEAQKSSADPEVGSRPSFEKPTCDACEEVFQSDLDVQRHQFSVHPAPPIKNGNGRVECPVPECHQDFAREHVMRRHIQSVHLQLREYQCQSCNRDFADQSTLNQHVTAVHLKRKPWTCSVCGQNFTQSSSLGKHRRRFHQDMVLSGTSGVEDAGKSTGNCSRESNHDDENLEELSGEYIAR
jgi:hypothetical protein